MKKNIGANISIILGVLTLLTFFSSFGSPDKTVSGGSFELGMLMIFGGAACKRIALERKTINITLEYLYLAIAFLPTLWTVNLQVLQYDPVPYFVAPVWLALAYFIKKIRAIRKT